MPSRDIRDGVCALLLSEAVRSALSLEAGRKEGKPSPFRSFLQCGQVRFYRCLSQCVRRRISRGKKIRGGKKDAQGLVANGNILVALTND